MVESDLSAEVNAVTVLTAGSSLSTTTTDGDVYLSWTNNDDSPDGGIGVERSTDGFSTVTTVASALSPSTTSYTDTTVSDNQTYEYRIERNTDHETATSASVRLIGESDLSAEVNAVTVLPAPSSLSASISNGDVALSWTVSDDSSDGGIDVERSTDGFSTITTLATLDDDETSYTDTSGTGGTAYEYRIERNTDHATATSGITSQRVPKRLTRTLTLTAEGQIDVNGTVSKTRTTTLTTDGQVTTTRDVLKTRSAALTSKGEIIASRNGTEKSRSTAITSEGTIHTRAEFNEVFPDEQTEALSWDFSFVNPFGFVSEWFEETDDVGIDVDAFSVVVDSFVSRGYELGVQYDVDGDGLPEYTSDTQSVTRDGETLVFPNVGEPGQYRLYIQQMRPEDYLRAVTVGPTRY